MYFRNNGGIDPNTYVEDKFSINEDVDYDTTQLEPNENIEGSFAESGVIDEAAVTENAIVQEVMMMNDEQRKAYMESDTFKSLVEAGVIGKKAVVRLNKEADMDRRIHLLCLQMGKENGDADWEALRKNRIQERKLLGKLYKKYGNRVRRQAAMSQKRIVKLNARAFDLHAPIR
jgi:hypothetical protein